MTLIRIRQRGGIFYTTLLLKRGDSNPQAVFEGF